MEDIYILGVEAQYTARERGPATAILRFGMQEGYMGFRKATHGIELGDSESPSTETNKMI